MNGACSNVLPSENASIKVYVLNVLVRDIPKK